MGGGGGGGGVCMCACVRACNCACVCVCVCACVWKLLLCVDISGFLVRLRFGEFLVFTDICRQTPQSRNVDGFLFD